MNHTTDNNDSGFADAIDQVAREFEMRWRQTPSLVIEDFLDSIDQLVRPFGIDGKKSENHNRIMAELIHLEIDLRCAHGHPFELDEYKTRFREYLHAVEEAFERVRQLYPQRFREAVLRTTRTRVGEDSESEGSLWIIEAAGHTEIPTELGPYREITWIGSGGFGDVCRAIDSRTDETVALKFPKHRFGSSSDVMELVKAEAEMAMRLSHSGIVGTRAIENIDSYAFIVQDFIDGMNLKMFMQKSDLSQRDIAFLIAQIADALAYAHREGIIHRDIKPQNILIDKSGKPFVADFGLAIHNSQRYETIGQPVCGTKNYFSPEVVSGRMYQIGGFYDVWSLGIVFYQLLSGDRPFGGPTDAILFAEISQKDPEPPHVVNHRVDPELDQFCLQCLEKKPGRRLTARKLAESLQSWLKQPATTRPTEEIAAGPPPKFVPKGLHSYTAKDAPFFLRLLPGPRDEYGVPASIRFWRDRILEPVAQEDRVPIGVIYGPSGSGKSSYVKAGLIPLINQEVKCLYVEATHADTDVRLLRALRHEFDIPPDQSSLPEILAGLREGKWQGSSRKKILICLDQFEQRLSAVGEFDPTELINALRHCDGENLQCLLLVRDDFLMSMSRFSDALGMDLREGQNTQIVDLFDRKHARKILTLLGHAYDRLSSDDVDELSKEEINFVNRAVDDQVEDQHVICVRLTVFAEMFKNQPWSVANLQEAGSETGVGVQFLDRELGPQNKKVPHQAAFRLLCSLLPASGTDIRGAMKSEADLAVAAGLPLDSSAFKKVITLLDSQLRLITRSDPDVSGTVETDDDKKISGDRHFQLTHDYLVPSIRAWQDKWLGDTRRGRAELRLQRLASEVVSGKTPENVPTHLEWLSWQVLLRRHRFTGNEQVVMRSARRRFFKDASLAASILIVVVGLISWTLTKLSRDQYADTLIAKMKDLNYTGLPEVVGELRDYKSRVVPKFQILLSSGTDQEKRRARLGLLLFDDQIAHQIVNDITNPDSEPEEFQAVIKIVQQTGTDCNDIFARKLNDTNNVQSTRFRAAVGLIGLNNHRGIDWREYSGLFATMLMREPTSALDGWIELLAPIGNQLRDPFAEMFVMANESNSAFPLASAIHEFCGRETAADFLVAKLLESNSSQFDSILDVFERRRNTGKLLESLINFSVSGLGDRAIANRALAMLRLGDPAPFLDSLGETKRPAIRSYSMTMAVSPRIEFDLLQQLLLMERVQDGPLIRQGVLLAISKQIPKVLDSTKLDWAKLTATKYCLTELDAGCFAAAELILRHLGVELMDIRQQRRDEFGYWKGSIYINDQLLAFSVLELPGKMENRKLAVSMTELSEKEFTKCPEFSEGNRTSTKMPHVVNDFDEVIQYCKWLDANDLDFPVTVEMKNGNGDASGSSEFPARYNFRFHKAEGYRLMNVSELLAVNREQIELTFLGEEYQLADHFAWTFSNSGGDTQPVGMLLPNRNGLHDFLGNSSEVCWLSLDGLKSFKANAMKVNCNLANLEPLLEIDALAHESIPGTLFFTVGGFARRASSRLSIELGDELNPSFTGGGVQPGIRLVRFISGEEPK